MLNERKLMADERPKKRYEYDVVGSKSFPVDMLRYDNAWPHATADAVSMMRHRTDDNYSEQRVVRLVSFYPPTRGRWASFGWSVR